MAISFKYIAMYIIIVNFLNKRIEERRDVYARKNLLDDIVSIKLYYECSEIKKK